MFTVILRVSQLRHSLNSEYQESLLKIIKQNIEGLGKVGYFAARALRDHGCKIIGIIEKKTSFYNPKGLDIDLISNWMVDSREPSEYPKQSEIKTRDEILSVGCDIFIPAAKEGTITEDNQKILNTKIICEGANGPLTSRADHYLNERGILIIPDL